MNDITREKILRNWFNSLTLESKDLLLEVWNCTIADMARNGERISDRINKKKQPHKVKHKSTE